MLYWKAKEGKNNDFILAGLHGGRETTAARYLQAHDPQLHVCFEDNAAVIAEVKHRGLDKNCYADYLEIQRLFLQMRCAGGRKHKNTHAP